VLNATRWSWLSLAAIGLLLGSTTKSGVGRGRRFRSETADHAVYSARIAAQVPPPPPPLPPALPFDPHSHLGLFPDRAIGDFVRGNVQGNGYFPTSYSFQVPDVTDKNKLCSLKIWPAYYSHNFDPSPKAGTAWYPLALITNETATPCQPRALGVAKGESGVWIGIFNAGLHSGEVSVGSAGVVVLSPAGSGHDRWSTGPAWSFKQCGHNVPHAADDALIWFSPPPICTYTAERSHDTRRISTELANRLPTDLVGNPILWFACGGDCCYSDLGT
jgi:hypothetical protein